MKRKDMDGAGKAVELRTIKVPPDLHRQFEIEAARKGVPIYQVVSAAWRSYRAAGKPSDSALPRDVLESLTEEERHYLLITLDIIRKEDWRLLRAMLDRYAPELSPNAEQLSPSSIPIGP